MILPCREHDLIIIAPRAVHALINTLVHPICCVCVRNQRWLDALRERGRHALDLLAWDANVAHPAI